MVAIVPSVTIQPGSFDSGFIPYTGPSGPQYLTISAAPVSPANVSAHLDLHVFSNPGDVLQINHAADVGMQTFVRTGPTLVTDESSVRLDPTDWTAVRVTTTVSGGPITLSVSVG